METQVQKEGRRRESALLRRASECERERVHVATLVKEAPQWAVFSWGLSLCLCTRLANHQPLYAHSPGSPPPWRGSPVLLGPRLPIIHQDFAAFL